MKRKSISILLALVLCLGLVPTAAFAASSDFTIENGILTKYNGAGGDVVIPDGTTGILPEAFQDCTSLTSVIIPDSVTYIGGSAFEGCTGLTNVTIPDGITGIGYYTFRNCTSLTNIIIPDSVTSIGGSAFYGCTGLTSVTIPDGVTSIGTYAFYNCMGLTSIAIPDSVMSIGAGAFSRCTGLTDIYVNSGNSAYIVQDGVLYNKEKTILLCLPAGHHTPCVIIPSTVTSIENAAFENCTGLTSVTIPDSVTSIGASAFFDCTGLTNVTIPDSVTFIGWRAFACCTDLTDVIISARGTSIASYAFSGCTGLTNVSIPDSVTRIEEGAFWGCTGITSVTIPDSVTFVSMAAFFNCTSLKDVHYSGTEAQWKQIAFFPQNNSLTSATIHYNSTTPVLETPTFHDVPADSWYFKEVNWAVQANITSGTGDGGFSPLRECTHGEIIGFLWKAAGQPSASTQAPVTVQSYFQDAVNWAYEKDIVDASFQTSAQCSRADVVLYMWKAAGMPPAGTSASFTDVLAGAGYSDAVSWAVENNVTQGTGDGSTFTPDKVCSRAEIVTFLYRGYAI